MIANEALPATRFETGDIRQLASARRDRVRFVDVPDHRYLALDGTEEPGSSEFVAGIGALYRVAHTLKGRLRARGMRTRVGLLDALYWLTPEELEAGDPTDVEAPRDWRWRLIIAAPEPATEDEVDACIARLSPDPLSERLYLDRWCEGPSAQILHVGPYAAESASIARLHAAIGQAGLRPHGPHHEIYLNDPFRVGEERARTVLRQPVMPA